MEKVMKLLIAIVLAFSVGYSMVAASASQGSVRIYKLNKKNQITRDDLTQTLSQGQCHDFRGGQPVHRFAQTRFQYCSLFSDKNCGESSTVTAVWGGSHYRVKGVTFDVSQPQGKLYRGAKWMIHPSQNLTILSMICH